MSFTQGLALNIGVGRHQYVPYADTPIVVEDAQAVEKINKDSNFYGYPDK